MSLRFYVGKLKLIELIFHWLQATSWKSLKSQKSLLIKLNFTRFKFYSFKSVTSGFSSIFSPLIQWHMSSWNRSYLSVGFASNLRCFFFFLEQVERAGKILFRKVTICLQLNYFYAQKQMENIRAKVKSEVS